MLWDLSPLKVLLSLGGKVILFEFYLFTHSFLSIKWQVFLPNTSDIVQYLFQLRCNQVPIPPQVGHQQPKEKIISTRIELGEPKTLWGLLLEAQMTERQLHPYKVITISAKALSLELWTHIADTSTNDNIPPFFSPLPRQDLSV